MSADERPIAVQLKTVYLATSETFIFRLLSHLRHWRPRVLAEHLTNLERFGLPDVRRLQRAALWQRGAFAVLRWAAHDETFRASFRWTPQLARDLSGARILNAHFGEAGLAALALHRRTGLPLITSFRGRDVAKPVGRPYGRLLYRRLFRDGAAFTVVSEHMRGQLTALGAAPERTVIVRDGIDWQAIPFRARTWSGDRPVRLLTCGRLVEKKGTRYAIEAIARLSDTHPEATLTVIGDGPRRASLERLAAELGVARSVRFLGARPFGEVLSALQEADLFLLPSVTAADGDQEGVPVVLMEAQAAGLPVVSTRHAGIPEVVRDGVSGFLVPERAVDALAERLRNLLAAPESWPALGEAGRAHVAAEFDLQAASDRLETLYNQIAGRPWFAAAAG